MPAARGEQVLGVTIAVESGGVDVVVQRGGTVWMGVHARRAQLIPDDADRLAGLLLAAAAAARGEA